MPKRFDTEGTPFLFTPHSEGELDEYFSGDHEKSVSAVAKDVIASLSESRDRLSGEVWYDFCYNQRRYKLTLITANEIRNGKHRAETAYKGIGGKEMNKPAFDLGAMLSAPAIQTAVQQIPCEKLHPYHNHKFELYTGERLDDMVASIKENGVLSPVIVQPDGDGYEILIGHNRWNACKIAGIDTIPAIIKQGLSEDEAEMYVIESNVMQRGFDNLRISEQAAVIALRHSEMFSPGKRSDIQRELALLEDPEAEANDTATLNPMGSRLDTNEEVGKEYGVSKGSVVRLIRINKLTDALKALVDSGDIAIRAGVELSFLSEKAQAVVAEQAEDFKVDMKKSKALHDAADKEGNIDTAAIVRIITGTAEVKPKPKSVKISEETFYKYFEPGTKKAQVTETVEKALAFYFANVESEA